MELIITSVSQDFVHRNRQATRLRFKLLLPAIFLIALAIRNIVDPNPRVRGRGIGLLLEGLFYTSGKEILLMLVISGISTFVVLWLLKLIYKNRKIIVEVKFNDIRRELSIKSKTIYGQESITDFSYNEIVLKKQRLSDGITNPVYDVITVLKKNEISGHLFINHFSWSNNDLNRIITKFQEVTKLVNKIQKS